MSSEFPKKTEADLRRPGLYQLPQLAKVTLLSYWISIVGTRALVAAIGGRSLR